MTDAIEAPVSPTRLDVDVVRSSTSPVVLRAAPPPADDEATGAAEVEPDADDEPLGTLVGEFSVYDAWYEIDSYWEGHFIERFAKGAFANTIKNRPSQSPVRVLLEHGCDPTVGDKPLGVPSLIEERDTGCYAETPLLNTSYNRDLVPALIAGAYGQSFRFRAMRDEWVEPGATGFDKSVPAAWANLPQVTRTEVQLMEFGPTVWPASPSTNDSTSLRSGTDEFYAALERRDPRAHDAALRSVRASRAAVPPQPEVQPLAPDTATPQERAQRPTPGNGVASDDTAKHPAPTTPEASRKETAVNPTMEQRAARLTEIDARLTEIDTENTGAALPSERKSEWDGLLAERAEHETAMRDQQERRAELERIAATTTGESAESVERSFADRLRGVQVRKPVTDPFDTVAVRRDARSLDDMTRMYKENARRAIEVVRFGTDQQSGQTQAMRLLDTVDDESGALAMRFIATGSPVYERAFAKYVKNGNVGLTSEEQNALTASRAMALGTDASGGYAVPFQLDPTIILTNDGAICTVRQFARVEQIVGKQWNGVTSAGTSVTRGAEAASAADASPSEGQLVVNATRASAFIPFSVELELAWSALRSELTRIIADQKDIEEAGSFVTGNGTAPNPQGFLTGATTAYTTAATGALTLADITGAKNALGARYRARASWAADSSFIDYARSLATYRTVHDVAIDAERSLVGKPFMEATTMPAFSLTTGTKLAVIGDFKQFLIVDRIGMQVEFIPQVFSASGTPTGQRGIWAWWENGSKVLNAAAFRTLTAK